MTLVHVFWQIRNKLNDQQNSKLSAQREILHHRKQEMINMDARIAELQLRLRSKKQVQAENQKQANRNHSNNILSSQGVNKPGWSGTVAAVEPYRVSKPEANPIHPSMSKQDPKYQSLPYNVKFPDPNKENRATASPLGNTKSIVKPATGFLPGSQNSTPVHPTTATQASPSILYASGESPGSPKTSTPMAGVQGEGSRPSNREIFITEAPAADKSVVHSHQRAGSYSEPERVAELKTGALQVNQRLSPNILSVPQHQKQGSSDSTTQRRSPDYMTHQALGQHHKQGSGDYTNHTASNQHHQQGFNEYTSHSGVAQHTRQGSNDYVSHKGLTQPGKQSSEDYVSHKAVIRHTKQESDDYTSHKSALQARSESAGILPGTAREQALPRQAQSDSNLTGNQSSSQPSSKPYRYASHDVIASTYMGKKHPSAIDQFKKNVSQYYKEFQEETVQKEDRVTGDTEPVNQTGEEGGAPGQILEGGQPVYNIDPELSRYGGKPNAPRPLRRRLSSGDSPEAHPPKQKIFHEEATPKPVHTQVPVTTASGNSDAPSKPVSTEPDLVRVDDIQKEASECEDEDRPVFTEEDIKVGLQEEEKIPFADDQSASPLKESLPVALRRKKGNLKTKDSTSRSRRVSFDPLALLLDAALEGELDLVMKSAHEVSGK